MGLQSIWIKKIKLENTEYVNVRPNEKCIELVGRGNKVYSYLSASSALKPPHLVLSQLQQAYKSSTQHLPFSEGVYKMRYAFCLLHSTHTELEISYV